MSIGSILGLGRGDDDNFVRELQALLFATLQSSFDYDFDLKIVLDEMDLLPKEAERVVMSALFRLGAFVSFIEACGGERSSKWSHAMNSSELAVVARELAIVPAKRTVDGKTQLDIEFLSARLLTAGVNIQDLPLGLPHQ